MSKNVKTEFSVDNMINDLVTKANKAKDEMLKLDQEAVDKIVAAMAKAGLEKHIELLPAVPSPDSSRGAAVFSAFCRNFNTTFFRSLFRGIPFIF